MPRRPPSSPNHPCTTGSLSAGLHQMLALPLRASSRTRDSSIQIVKDQNAFRGVCRSSEGRLLPTSRCVYVHDENRWSAIANRNRKLLNRLPACSAISSVPQQCATRHTRCCFHLKRPKRIASASPQFAVTGADWACCLEFTRQGTCVGRHEEDVGHGRASGAHQL